MTHSPPSLDEQVIAREELGRAQDQQERSDEINSRGPPTYKQILRWRKAMGLPLHPQDEALLEE